MDEKRRPAAEITVPQGLMGGLATGERITSAAVLGIFLILFIGLLNFAKEFFLPVSLAFLLALVFSPIVRSLRNRGVPEVVSAVVLVLTVFVGLSVAAYGLSGPVAGLISNAPAMTLKLKARIVQWSEPIQKIFDMPDKAGRGAKNEDSSAREVMI